MPGRLLNTLHKFTSTVLPTTLGYKSSDFRHLTDKNTEAKRNFKDYRVHKAREEAETK